MADPLVQPPACVSPLLFDQPLVFGSSPQGCEVVLPDYLLWRRKAFIEGAAQVVNGAFDQAGTCATARLKVAQLTSISWSARRVGRWSGLTVQNVRVKCQRLGVCLRTLAEFVLQQQIGGSVPDQSRRPWAEFDRLPVEALGRPIIPLLIFNGGQIVQRVRVVGVPPQAFLIAADGVLLVEEHLVGDAHLVPHGG